MQEHWYDHLIASMFLRSFSSSFGIGFASDRLQTRPIWLSALTGVLLIPRRVRTRLCALHRLAGSSRARPTVWPLGKCCGRNEGWGRRACVFSSCYVHVSVQTFFFSVPPFLFWCCLLVPCRPVLLVPTMHDGDRRLIPGLFSLTGFTLHTVCR